MLRKKTIMNMGSMAAGPGPVDLIQHNWSQGVKLCAIPYIQPVNRTGTTDLRSRFRSL